MIVVIGAGAYGSALAIHWAKHGKSVTLLTRSKQKTELNNIHITQDMSVLKDANVIFFAIPAQSISPYIKSISIPTGANIVIGAKGIDLESGCFLSQIVARHTTQSVSVWSGPHFASEVAQDLPSAVTLASDHFETAQRLGQFLSTPRLKVYPSSDVLAVELCGALKNVIAIACGVARGLNLGENAIAALVTRGLAEIRRLGLALGAQNDSFFELACIGDLMLTCSSLTSRNCAFGYALAQGHIFNNATLVEGYHTTKAAYELSKKMNVYMPITHAVYDVLYNNADLQTVVKKLLTT